MTAMNRYLLCLKASEAPNKPTQWYTYDWASFVGRESIYRPTEYAAFTSLQKTAYDIRKTSEILDFDEDMWLVYFKDLELHYNATNGRVTANMIAHALHYKALHVEACLRTIDRVVAARLSLGMTDIPPVPLRHVRKQRAIERLAAKRGIKRN